MKLKHKILNLLITNKSKEFTIREVSILLKTDYKNTYDAIKQLEPSINITKKGNASYLKFKPILTIDAFETENLRKNNINLPLIKKDIASLENPFFIAILFGSYSKKLQKKHSDIDICIIHNNEKDSKIIENKLSIHPKIEIQSFHHKEFIQMLKSKEFNVAHEIMNDGIVLRNIELYYEVIKYG